MESSASEQGLTQTAQIMQRMTADKLQFNNRGNLWGYVNQAEADFKQNMLLNEMNRQYERT